MTKDVFALERVLAEEIRAWSQEQLEVEEEGLSACPYAKAAWDNDRVKLIFKHDKHKQALYSAISQFEDRYDVTVLVDLAFDKAEDFHDYVEELNEAISKGVFIDRNIWVMGFHPEDDVNEAVDDGGFEPLVEVSYAMYFIQRLDKLQTAAEKLLKQDYYKKYFGEAMPSHVFETRESYARRL